MDTKMGEFYNKPLPEEQVGAGVLVTIVEHLVHDVFELHHGDADKLVVATEAVVLDADVQLVGGHLLLVADDAEQQEGVDKSGGEEKQGVDLQVEGLVELWRPIAGLLFCLELPLLIRKVRS